MAAYGSRYDGKKTEKHAFSQVVEDLKLGVVPPVVYLFGHEQYLVNWAVGAFIDKFVDPGSRQMDLTVLEAEGITVEAIKEACETFSMLSERRVVLVRDFNPLIGKKLKDFGKTQEDELAEYLQHIPGGCLLIFTSDKASQEQESRGDKKAKSGLYSAIEKYGRVYNFQKLDNKTLTAFITKEFKKEGKVLKPSVIKEYLSTVGYFNKTSQYTLYQVVNDVRKISAYARGEEILMEDVAANVERNMEATIFLLMDALSAGKKDEAYRMLDEILAQDSSLESVLGYMCSQYEVILQIKELLEEGKNLKEIAGVLKVHEFRVQKAMPVAKRQSVERLRKTLIKAMEIEKNYKTGLLGSRLAMEVFIGEI